jgi:hypothetical protein
MENKVTDKKKIVTIVLLCVALGLMTAGAVLMVRGLQPIMDYLTQLMDAMNGGGLPEFPAMSEFTLAIVGVVLLVAGIICLIVSGKINKRIKRAAQEEIKTEQMLMRLAEQYDVPVSQSKPTAAGGAMRYCPYCGKPIDHADYDHCPYCGKLLS